MALIQRLHTSLVDRTGIDRLWSYQKWREKRGKGGELQDIVETFVHDPLPLDQASIRLIEVLPLDETGTIKCRIRPAILGALVTANDTARAPTNLVYTCLSYVWGPDNKVHRILLNGNWFEVRDNLWRFLKHVSSMTTQKLRDEDGESYALNVGEWWQALWIDALCIDQQSIGERNHQVQQMGRIYSDATRVISWLGGDAYIQTLFRTAQKMSMRHEMHVYDGFLLIRNLCKNEYWKRAWVTQELLSAQELFLMAGNIIIPSHKLELTMHRLNDEQSRTELDKILIYLRTRLPTLESSRRLIHNLEVYHGKSCADVRDRVYSLLSVSSDGSRILVDYGCTPTDLMMKVIHLSADVCCLRTALVALDALHSDRRLSDGQRRLRRRELLARRFDQTLAMTIHNTGELSHVSPCAHCGSDERMFRTGPKERGVNDTYFCLRCQHPEASTPKEAHQSSDTGHLRLVWGMIGAVKESSWNLFWAPETCWPWHRLHGYKEVRTNPGGTVQDINLSVDVLDEISDCMSIATPFERQDIQFYKRAAQYLDEQNHWYVMDRTSHSSRRKNCPL